MRRRRFRARGRRRNRRARGITPRVILNPMQRKSVVVKLPMLVTYNLSPTGVNVGYTDIAVNDIADPLAGGGAKRGRGYSTMYSWYSSARCLRTYYSVKAVSKFSSTGGNIGTRFGVYFDTASTPTDTTIASGQRKMMHYYGGRYKTLYSDDVRGAIGLGQAIKGVVDGRKYHRESDPRDSKWTVTSAANLAAPEITYMHIWAGPIDFNTDVGAITLEVRLTFEVMFFDPVVQTNLEPEDA